MYHIASDAGSYFATSGPSIKLTWTYKHDLLRSLHASFLNPFNKTKSPRNVKTIPKSGKKGPEKERSQRRAPEKKLQKSVLLPIPSCEG